MSLFRILAIDGGGFRGVYPAHILARIEETFGVDFKKDFDLIVGTSTGSIIAAALAIGKSPKEIRDLYSEHGRKIFDKKLFDLLNYKKLFLSTYNSEYLRKCLSDTFGDVKLGDIEFPLIIPSTDIGNGGVHVFKSKYQKEYTRDGEVSLVDAVMASCAAPTYFDPFWLGDKYLLADGGLWANSPGLVGVIDAKKRLGVNLDDIRVLSIGTGVSKVFFSPSDSKFRILRGWGFLARWDGKNFIDMLLNLQSESANNMLSLLVDKTQVLRINYDSEKGAALDDARLYKALISKADRDFTHNTAQLLEFLG